MRQRTLAFTWVAAVVLAVAAAAAPPHAVSTQGLSRAVFAGGCFWCEEAAFEGLPGVVTVTSGYAGGQEPHPTYEQVGHGHTGHAESVEVVFDPKATSYEKLLEVYWHNVDPTKSDRAFCDVGRQYRPAIFYADEAQKEAAQASKDKISATKPFRDPIVVEIAPVVRFWPAEEYHQDYYKKNPLRYKFYRSNCGRDQRLKELWGAPGREAE
jgi:peptide-methionine (S)-S-oxide reductase